jgi:glutaredoxin-like YruB-family protein
MIIVNSLEHLHSQVKPDESNWVFLYKKGSDASECALKSLQTAYNKIKGINLFIADVSEVRDIHTHYNITSAPSLLHLQGKLLKNVVKGCNDVSFYDGIFNNSVFVAQSANGEKPAKRVTVYSTPTCSWCNTLKSHLRQNNIRFQDIDVSRDQRAADELVKRSGQMGVPQTDINGEIIVGFNKTRINELLDING